MNRSRFYFFLVSSAVALPLLAGSLFAAASSETSEGDSLYKYLSVFTEALGLVDQTYVEETDLDVLMSSALDGATDALGPMAVYVPAGAVERYEATRRVGTDRSGLFLLHDRGMLYAVAVQPGSPAETAGLEPGDLISEIDGRPTRKMGLWEARELLARAAGTSVQLEVLRYSDTLEKSLVLGDFDVPRATLTRRDGVDVLRIPGFDASTAGEVASHLASLRDRDIDPGQGGLLIDLRDVAGGEPSAAYAVAGLFADGPLGRLMDRDETVESFAGASEDGAEPWSGRLVVLTDRSTLGAAEILATVLRQKADAELVGERTFGYAGRETGIDLSTGARLFLTDAFYTGPDFEPLNEPLQPDERVERGFLDDEDDEDDAEDQDRVLERGIERLLAAPEPAEEQEAAAAA
jgi:carboxyl-terminal processing protease